MVVEMIIAPVKGTSAPAISRLLGKSGLSSYSVQNVKDAVMVSSRAQPESVRSVLDKAGYVYATLQTPTLTAFRVIGRRKK